MPRFTWIAAFVTYVAGFAVLAWPWMSGRVTIPWDAKSQSFPNLVFLAHAFRDGQSPFWSPHTFAGWPQIADPQSLIFSPLHVLLAALNGEPSFVAADAVTFAHLFIGGFGLLLLFRDRGWHPAGAVVAALSFAFGGSNASRLQHIGMVESVCWLPLALGLLLRALDRAPQRDAVYWGAAAGLAAALVALGRDQVSLLGLYLLAGAVLWHGLAGAGRWPRLRASLSPLLAGALTGAVVLAIPVTLTALLAADSNRPEIGYDIAARGSLHPSHLLTLVFADLFGASDPKVPFWGVPSFPWHETLGQTDLYHAQNIGQLYMGALAIVVLLGLGVVRGWLWSRDIRFFSVAAALMLLYALGRYTPAFWTLYEALPGVSLYRRPADATFHLGLLLAVIIGYLVHRWLTEPSVEQKRAQGIAQVAIVLALIATAVGLAVTLHKVSEAVTPIAVAMLCAALGCLVLWIARRGGAARPLAAVVLLGAFVTADLGWNNAPHESNGLPPQTYDALRIDTRNETIGLLKWRLAQTAAPDRRDRVEMIGIGYHWPNAGLIHGFDHLFGHNPLRLGAFSRATNASDTVAVADQRRFSPLLPSYRAPLENLFGVRLIATGVPAEQIDKSLTPDDLNSIARTKEASVYENARALPRVQMLTDWREVSFAQLLDSGSWPDADPAKTVLLERAPDGLTIGGGAGRVSIVRYANTEVELAVDSPSGGMLVLNDVWHPWWRATLDGRPVEIMKANVLFRAVAVPAGLHVVRFRFLPLTGAAAQLRARLSGWR